MALKWVKFENNVLLCNGIPDSTNASVQYDTKLKELTISEYGKHYDDHAVVVFKVKNLKHAEDILSSLKEIFTA